MSAANPKPFNQAIRINTLRIGFLLLLPMLFIVVPLGYPRETILQEGIEVLGFAMVIGCVLGRFWSILYIGGHKNKEVVQIGPYSMCRHPLYLFSIIGVAGLGFMLESVVLGLTLGGLAYLIKVATARKEEQFLRAEFGDAYDDYAKKTPMILPKISNFYTPDTYEFKVSDLRGNLFDAFVFLAFIPLVEIIEWAHEHYQFFAIILP